MDKNVIRLTESELKRIVNEATNKILSENDWYGNPNDPRWRERREKLHRKRNNSHAICLEALYNIQESINKAVELAEKGKYHNSIFNNMHANCYTFVRYWREIISQLK